LARAILRHLPCASPAFFLDFFRYLIVLTNPGSLHSFSTNFGLAKYVSAPSVSFLFLMLTPAWSEFILPEHGRVDVAPDGADRSWHGKAMPTLAGNSKHANRCIQAWRRT